MATHKVLASVAHNIGASFTSLMNYCENDYVMGTLLTRARSSGDASFFIDFTNSTWSTAFDERPLKRIAPFYTNMFWTNVASQGSARELVKVARLDLTFDLAQRRPAAVGDENPYKCVVTLIDDRGVDHSRQHVGWWFPEPFTPTGLRGWIARLRWHFGV